MSRSPWPPPGSRSDTTQTVGRGCAYLILVCCAVILVATTVAVVRWMF